MGLKNVEGPEEHAVKEKNQKKKKKRNLVVTEGPPGNAGDKVKERVVVVV